VLNAARAREARQLGPLRPAEHGLPQARVPPGVPRYALRTAAVPGQAALRPGYVQHEGVIGTRSPYVQYGSSGTYVSTQAATARAALRSRARPRCGGRGCAEARPGPRSTCQARIGAVRVRGGAEEQARIGPRAPAAGDDGVAAGKRSLPAPFTTSHLFAKATPALREGVLLPSAFHAAVLHAHAPATTMVQRTPRQESASDATA
jgi:hypothetical protein